MPDELDELELISNFFFDRMLDDEDFMTLFGSTKAAARIGQPMADQGAPFPLARIQDLGGYNGGVFRTINSGVEYVWIQRKVLVAFAADGRRYPNAIANKAKSLFKLTASLDVTGGTIYHCYLDPVEGLYKAQYPDKSNSKIVSEKGAYWIIAAKVS